MNDLKLIDDDAVLLHESSKCITSAFASKERAIKKHNRYCAMTIADWIIAMHTEVNDFIGGRHLNFLLYISYGWHWAFHREELFWSKCEAWHNGVVYPEVHYGHGGASIINKIRGIWELRYLLQDEQRSETLQWVFDKYYNWNAHDLERITCCVGSPWRYTYGDRDCRMQEPLTQKYYEALFAKSFKRDALGNRTLLNKNTTFSTYLTEKEAKKSHKL